MTNEEFETVVVRDKKLLLLGEWLLPAKFNFLGLENVEFIDPDWVRLEPKDSELLIFNLIGESSIVSVTFLLSLLEREETE